MISYQVYKLIHLLGIFFVIASLGGMTLHMINGGSRDYRARKWAALFHGIGLFLVLLGGFGLMARIGVAHAGWPLWIWGKLIIWLVLGALPALVYRKKSLAKLFWILTFLFAMASAYMAIYKPMFPENIDANSPAAQESPNSEPSPESTPGQ
jgi:hypothetical protein